MLCVVTQKHFQKGLNTGTHHITDYRTVVLGHGVIEAHGRHCFNRRKAFFVLQML